MSENEINGIGFTAFATFLGSCAFIYVSEYSLAFFSLMAMGIIVLFGHFLQAWKESHENLERVYE